jgi:hypothetical protein
MPFTTSRSGQAAAPRRQFPRWLSTIEQAAVLAACAAALSCGGGSGDQATSADVMDTCRAVCDQKPRCTGQASPADCVPSCLTKVGNSAILSRDALALVAQCFADPACIDEEKCEDLPAARDPALVAEEKRCSAYVQQCGEVVDGGFCGTATYYTRSVRRALEACYVGTCERATFLSCLDGVFGRSDAGR